MISFDCTEKEHSTISKIAARAVQMAAKHGIEYDIIDAEMDITATHANGTPLRLDALLAADEFNFAHDVFGIRGTLDRKTGKLTNNFSPRFSV